MITPSGVPPDAIQPDSIVRLQANGMIEGPGTPSSEWRMHCDILNARPDVNAVVHTHSTFATTLSTLRQDIPAFHYMVAVAGGDSVRCSGYALFGTEKLSRLAVLALEGRKACLLGNHGLIALGRSLPEAVAVALEVEALSEQYWRALQLGQPRLLDADEMQEVIEKFRSYGAFSQDTERS